MRNKKNNLRLTALWLAPSVSELIIYVFLGIITIAISNLDFVRTFIYAPVNFNLKNSVLGSVNSILDHFVGVGVARTTVVIVFWALVGLLVYVFIWVFTNFSDELGNELSVKGYAHPSNVDTSKPLRAFLSRTAFRLMVFILLLFYLSLFWHSLLPFCIQHFKTAVDQWPHMEAFIAGGTGLLVEVIALHAFIVFARLLLIKRRILG